MKGRNDYSIYSVRAYCIVVDVNVITHTLSVVIGYSKVKSSEQFCSTPVILARSALFTDGNVEKVKPLDGSQYKLMESSLMLQVKSVKEL